MTVKGKFLPLLQQLCERLGCPVRRNLHETCKLKVVGLDY